MPTQESLAKRLLRDEWANLSEMERKVVAALQQRQIALLTELVAAKGGT